MKVLDEVFHSKLQSTHTIRPSLLERLLVGPMVVRDPVTGDDGTSSIGSTVAMHEYAFIGIRFQPRQDPEDCNIGWSVQLGEGFTDVLHADSFDGLRFGGDRVLTGQTEVNYLPYSELRQARPPYVRWLATTVHLLINPVKIGNARRFVIGCARLEHTDQRRGAQNKNVRSH